MAAELVSPGTYVGRKGVRGLSAEVFHFNVAGKVSAAYAHYVSV